MDTWGEQQLFMQSEAGAEIGSRRGWIKHEIDSAAVLGPESIKTAILMWKHINWNNWPDNNA